MSYFSLHDLSVTLGNFSLNRISLSLESGQTLVILGPSGSGKSVLLETIAGFNTSATGRIELNGEDISPLPPEKRSLGYVFQNYALFPHLTVEQNIAFGLKKRSDNTHRTREMLDFLEIRHLARRRPDTLSGGEKQRVALARALATNPLMFLFDEPLSAVDAAARDSLRDELHNFLGELHTTSLYVTHDRTEALMLADYLAIINNGEIRQIGKANEVFASPVDAWVARFLGMQVLPPDWVDFVDAGHARVGIGGATLLARARNSNGHHWKIVFQPEDVRITRRNDHRRESSDAIPLTVDKVLPLGPLIRIDLNGPVSMTALLFRRYFSELNLSQGDTVTASINAADLQLVPDAETTTQSQQ